MNSVPCTLRASDPPVAGNTEGGMMAVDIKYVHVNTVDWLVYTAYTNVLM